MPPEITIYDATRTARALRDLQAAYLLNRVSIPETLARVLYDAAAPLQDM